MNGISKQKINTIISYRKRKNLCLKCGKDIHSGECIEDYTKSDNRSEEEKLKRPAIISTKTKPQKTIFQKIKSNEIITLQPTQPIRLLRPFIIIDTHPSRLDKIIEWNAILQISKIDTNIITFIVDPNKQYNILNYNNLKKTPNLQILSCKDEQEYINYIASCSFYYSYPSKYTSFSVLQNIKTAIFDEKYNVTSFLKNINYVIPKERLFK